MTAIGAVACKEAGGIDILVNNAALFDLAADRRDHAGKL